MLLPFSFFKGVGRYAGLALLDDDGIVRVGALQHASRRDDAVFADDSAPKDDHITADPSVVADLYGRCHEFLRFHAAGDTKIVVMVINFRVRANLNALANGDLVHTGDADAVAQRGIRANFQQAVCENGQLRASVGTNLLSQMERAVFGNHNFRVWGETLDAVNAEAATVNEPQKSELDCAEKNADYVE